MTTRIKKGKKIYDKSDCEELQFFAIRSVREVANILGVSYQTVHRIEHRAIHKIRVRLNELHKEIVCPASNH